MRKNQAYKAMQRSRLGSSSAALDEVENDMVDGSFHSPEWHAARLASLKTSHTITWEEYKKKQKVLLHDWWLIKADSDSHGKRLGLGGFTTKESQGTRCFVSAPIVKRHDAVTLQTADGITITVSGHLNRSRTLNNGFPLKVCNDFVFGFPYYWKESASLSFDGLETTSENSEHVSLDTFPTSILPDLIVKLGHHESSLVSKIYFDDILQSTGAGASSSDGELGSKKASPFNVKNTVSTLDEALLNPSSSSKAQRKHKGSKNAFVAEPSTNVKRRLMQENNDVADKVLTSGPITRSRSRLIMRIGQN